ncbi:cytochrome P450 [Streptomyces sp. NBC_00841]|uniref:cytochrome P450 n=1 Tax=unclassified Streptomyces TaxID=2593676 RepID=UPI0022544897|nr:MULTISPECIES: cytochrome P450 [unclassified Streptomyces]MCX4531278.1 cytochrome P450 [Streptomyces sp. NBC_01669]WSA03137.1 cytochrome P450 [Streptomyces sp. NBC_00841]
MTTPFHHEPGAAMGPVPPPECPAHGLGVGPGGLRRFYGPEAERDPAGLYDKLRAEHGTVAPILLHGDVPAWLVLGHSENLHMTRTPSQFSRDSRRWRALQDGSVAPDHPLAPIFTWQPVCVFADGATHERQRGAVTDSMARIDHRGVRRHINRYSNRLVNEFCQDGRVDLVGQFAERLPMMVMCEILGMPEECNDRMVQAARDMTRGTATAVASNAYVVAALDRLVRRRRTEPAADFATWLVEHPAGMTDTEVTEHLRLILIAAYEATANLIANVLRMVLTDPRFRARLSGGHMTVPEAVEQTLWDEPPFTAVFGRWAVGDTELGGQRIREGDALIVGIAPANTDPVVRPDLAADMEGNRAHLAFSGGPHECPGQDIGRAIADVGVDALLMRLPDLELAVEEGKLNWIGNIMSRHLLELPAGFAARSPQDDDELPSMARSTPPREDWEGQSPVSHTTPAPVPAGVAAQAGQSPADGVRTDAPPHGASADRIPQQRRPAAPARLWHAVTRWWSGS